MICYVNVQHTLCKGVIYGVLMCHISCMNVYEMVCKCFICDV